MTASRKIQAFFMKSEGKGGFQKGEQRGTVPHNANDEDGKASKKKASGGEALSSRMKFIMHLFKMLPCHMGVNLGGGNIDMAQHQLNGPQIRAALQEVTGKGVAQAVGRNFLFNADLQGVFAKKLPKPLACHGAACPGHE